MEHSSVVAPVRVSASARAKARRRRTEDSLPVHSFRSLLRDLAALVRNQLAAPLPGTQTFEVLTRLTPLQEKAFDLLGGEARAFPVAHRLLFDIS